MLTSTATPGVFGKLPAHGDFVMRNLSSNFVNSWDEWLQGFMLATQERIGDEWLNTYLTSPIWRFVLSAGVMDDNTWTGIVMPSVDRVGRYYPFSIITQLPSNTNPMEFISQQASWFEALEKLALAALHGQMTIDELSNKLGEFKCSFDSSYRKNASSVGVENSLQIDMEFEVQLPSSVYAHFLDYYLVNSLSSYSVWSTSGSERIEPCLFTTQHLPATDKMPAMLDGQWRHWGHTQPYILAQSNIVGPA